MRSLANRSGCSLIGHYRLLPVHCVEGKGNAPPSTLMVISSRNTITLGIVSPPHVSVGAVPFLLPWLGCNCQSRKQSRLRCPPSVTAACTESSKRFRIHSETRQRISFTFFHTSPLSARCPPLFRTSARWWSKYLQEECSGNPVRGFRRPVPQAHGASSVSGAWMSYRS